MKPVFVIVVGGLGRPQTGDIIAALLPLKDAGVTIWTPVLDDSQYRAPITEEIMLRPSSRIALVGHSYAGAKVAQACEVVADAGVEIDYLCMIDPVDPMGKEVRLPEGSAAPSCYDWLVPEDNSLVGLLDKAFIRSAKVIGASATLVPGTDHNSICHAKQTIDLIVQRVSVLTG